MKDLVLDRRQTLTAAGLAAIASATGLTVAAETTAERTRHEVYAGDYVNADDLRRDPDIVLDSQLQAIRRYMEDRNLTEIVSAWRDLSYDPHVGAYFSNLIAELA